VLTGLVTTGVLADVEEAVVLLHVADVAGVLTTDGVDTSAVTAARRAKAVMLAPFETAVTIKMITSMYTTQPYDLKEAGNNFA